MEFRLNASFSLSAINQEPMKIQLIGYNNSNTVFQIHCQPVSRTCEEEIVTTG